MDDLGKDRGQNLPRCRMGCAPRSSTQQIAVEQIVDEYAASATRKTMREALQLSTLSAAKLKIFKI